MDNKRELEFRRKSPVRPLRDERKWSPVFGPLSWWRTGRLYTAGEPQAERLGSSAEPAGLDGRRGQGQSSPSVIPCSWSTSIPFVPPDRSDPSPSSRSHVHDVAVSCPWWSDRVLGLLRPKDVDPRSSWNLSSGPLEVLLLLARFPRGRYSF